MSHRPDPEMNSVHSVKILLCYILDKLNRTVTEEQLRLISEDSGVISYFFFPTLLKSLSPTAPLKLPRRTAGG